MYDQYEQAKRFQTIADEIFDCDLTSIRFNGPREQIDLTKNSQPIIYTKTITEVILCQQHQIDPYASTPTHVVGHSFGQLPAITAAGCLGDYTVNPEQVFTNGISLVKSRVLATTSACEINPGSMMAVGSDETHGLQLSPHGRTISLKNILPAFGLHLSVINSDEEIVVGGKNQSLSVFSEFLARQPTPPKTTLLRIEGPFHTPLMQPAVEIFAPEVRRLVIYPPKYPIISNVTARPLTTVKQIQDELINGLVSTVRWKDIVSYLDSQGMTKSIEVGTPLLSRFTKKQLGGGLATVIAAAGIAYVAWNRHQQEK